MNGRAATAPCGHPGEVVIGTFVKCLTAGCDGLPKKPNAQVDLFDGVHWVRCPICATFDVEPFPIDGVVVSATGAIRYHCGPLGHVFEVA